MTDSEFLTWVANRLVKVYGENENTDFVHKLKRLSEELRSKQIESAQQVVDAIKSRIDELQIEIDQARIT